MRTSRVPSYINAAKVLAALNQHSNIGALIIRIQYTLIYNHNKEPLQ